jgi:hypothetical protein
MVTSRSFLVLGCSLVISFLLFGIQIGRAVKRGREFDRYLTVRGLSEREVKATLAIWPIRFSVAAEDLDGLKTAMERDRAEVLDFLQQNGLTPDEITQGLPTINDREDEKLQSKRPELLPRYRATGSLVVRSSNVDVVKKAIQSADALLQRGVTLAGPEYGEKPQFTFEGINQTKPEMIQEATASARAAAQKFAADSHSSVGRIRKAIQGVLEIEDRDPASPEWKILRIVTTVDFFLE